MKPRKPEDEEEESAEDEDLAMSDEQMIDTSLMYLRRQMRQGAYKNRVRAGLKKLMEEEDEDRTRSEDSRHRGFAQVPSATPLFMATPEQQATFTAAFNNELLPQLRHKFFGS